jgi:hypothetical protein
MNKPYYNDQAHIAEEFQFIDEHTSQTARLAFFKINSYKLSLIKASFSTTKEDLSSLIRSTLLNYTNPGRILADLGYFKMEREN